MASIGSFTQKIKILNLFVPSIFNQIQLLYFGKCTNIYHMQHNYKKYFKNNKLFECKQKFEFFEKKIVFWYFGQVFHRKDDVKIIDPLYSCDGWTNGKKEWRCCNDSGEHEWKTKNVKHVEVKKIGLLFIEKVGSQPT